MRANPLPSRAIVISECVSYAERIQPIGSFCNRFRAKARILYTPKVHQVCCLYSVSFHDFGDGGRMGQTGLQVTERRRGVGSPGATVFESGVSQNGTEPKRCCKGVKGRDKNGSSERQFIEDERSLKRSESLRRRPRGWGHGRRQVVPGEASPPRRARSTGGRKKSLHRLTMLNLWPKSGGRPMGRSPWV